MMMVVVIVGNRCRQTEPGVECRTSGALGLRPTVRPQTNPGQALHLHESSRRWVEGMRRRGAEARRPGPRRGWSYGQLPGAPPPVRRTPGWLVGGIMPGRCEGG